MSLNITALLNEQVPCMVIKLAVKAITGRRVTKHSIRTLSDSMSVLEALSIYDMNLGLICDSHNSFMEVFTHNYISL